MQTVFSFKILIQNPGQERENPAPTLVPLCKCFVAFRKFHLGLSPVNLHLQVTDFTTWM